jgi:microcystin-dependent protein
MWPTKTYTFSPSTTIASAKLNQNFDDLLNAVNTAMPSGGIIIWSGAIASIPAGWYLCDGNNSTPDLRGKFVLGAGGVYGVNAVGGEETHVLNTNEMPSHTHYLASVNKSGNDGGGGTTELSGRGSNYQTTSTGGGAAHNNMPPYIALAYIRKS